MGAALMPFVVRRMSLATACFGCCRDRWYDAVRGAAKPQDDRPNLGLVMWSSFSCATYAELSSDEKEQKRLFTVGYSRGKQFVAAIENKTVSEKEISRAPLSVLQRLQGPSIDFMIGRIFEGATEDAFDKVVKEDNNGLPILDPRDWADGELKVARARNKYQTSNCALIQ
jgi:hypothetical protein